AKRVDPNAVGTPKPSAALKAGTYKYAAKIEMGGQNIALAMKTDIKEEGGAWTVTDTTSTPMGEMTDVAVLDKETLNLRKRSVRQGPASVDMEVVGNKATGKMNMGGKESPIDVDLGGPLFA